MNSKDVAVLEKQLRSVLPSLRRKGSGLLVCPIDHAIRGLAFESSSFGKNFFYVWIYYMPVFVPSAHTSFQFGARLRTRGREQWDLGDPRDMLALSEVVRAEALPVLERVCTPRGMVADIEVKLKEGRDPYLVQGAAYTYARLGQHAAAAGLLREMIGRLDAGVDWQRALAEQARVLMVACTTGPDRVDALLEGWTRETMRNLKLDTLCPA